MSRACVLFRPGVHYRRDEFAAGLKATGFSIETSPRMMPAKTDLLLLWNRKGQEERMARRYEMAGARVVIAENGYISGPRAKQYALAIGQHNGAGTWRVGGPERFDNLGVDLAPWRRKGRHVLVLPQRGIGPAGVAMPPAWAHFVMKDLPTRTHRPVVLRRHPGSAKTEPYDALEGAWCAVTWGSGAGIKALAAGYPVFSDFKRWVGAPAAAPLTGADLERPRMDSAARLAVFQSLAWAQWTIQEIVSGDAFAWLLKL